MELYNHGRVDLSLNVNVYDKHAVSIFSPENGGSIFNRNTDTCDLTRRQSPEQHRPVTIYSMLTQ